MNTLTLGVGAPRGRGAPSMQLGSQVLSLQFVRLLAARVTRKAPMWIAGHDLLHTIVLDLVIAPDLEGERFTDFRRNVDDFHRIGAAEADEFAVVERSAAFTHLLAQMVEDPAEGLATADDQELGQIALVIADSVNKRQIVRVRCREHELQVLTCLRDVVFDRFVEFA